MQETDSVFVPSFNVQVMTAVEFLLSAVVTRPVESTVRTELSLLVQVIVPSASAGVVTHLSCMGLRVMETVVFVTLVVFW